MFDWSLDCWKKKEEAKRTLLSVELSAAAEFTNNFKIRRQERVNVPKSLLFDTRSLSVGITKLEMKDPQTSATLLMQIQTTMTAESPHIFPSSPAFLSLWSSK